MLLAIAAIEGYLLLRARETRSQATPIHVIRADDLPAVLQKLLANSKDGSFACFIVPDPSRPHREPLNLQFAVENGRVGFDWLLVQEPNIEDQHSFVELTASRGQHHRRLAMNGVSYLRVESGDLASLAMAVLQNLYGVANDHQLEMIAEGFEWPPQ